MSENEGFSYREKDNTNRYVLVNNVDVKKFKTYFIPAKPAHLSGPVGGNYYHSSFDDFRNPRIMRCCLGQAINLRQ
jgi:hypothetical protein